MLIERGFSNPKADFLSWGHCQKIDLTNGDRSPILYGELTNECGPVAWPERYLQVPLIERMALNFTQFLSGCKNGSKARATKTSRRLQYLN